jgi:hypothetical protein
MILYENCPYIPLEKSANFYYHVCCREPSLNAMGKVLFETYCNLDCCAEASFLDLDPIP